MNQQLPTSHLQGASTLARKVSRIVSLAILSGYQLHCAGYEFTVEGEVRLQGYWQGRYEGETNYNFTVEIRDCSSRIRVFGGRFSGTEFDEYGWDGTNAYMFVKLRDDRATNVIRYVEDGIIKSKQMDRPVKSDNDGTLSISLEALPDNGHGMEPIWLAYASGCYYEARKSGGSTEPVWWMGVGVRDAGRRFPTEWRLNQSVPRLLEYLADFTDGNKYESTGSTPVPVRMSKPFDVPTTNSVYQVLNWTNVAGMTLPQRFRVVRYVPNTESRSSASSLHILEVYEGVAHTIRPICAVSDFGPRIPGAVPTQVADRRFEGGIGYFSPTGQIASLEQVKPSKRTQEAVRTIEVKPDSQKLRWGLILLLCISLSFPVWLLTKWMWRTKK